MDLEWIVLDDDGGPDVKRSPIVNPATDATYEQNSDPAIQGYIPNGSIWYKPETNEMRYRDNGHWELIQDDEFAVGDIWYDNGKAHVWNGTSWSAEEYLHF